MGNWPPGAQVNRSGCSESTPIPYTSAMPIAVEAARSVGLSIDSVRKVFDRGVVAIEQVDLRIGPGEFVAILGPSGCGKSTLLRLIAYLDRPTSGSISVERTKSDIAFVFQDAHLLPWRNVLKNVALPLELMGAARDERLDAAHSALKSVGLDDAWDRYPSQLSGGMRMRASLARALVTRPKLLLLDEPFAALDEITRQRLDEQLRQLWIASGMTVIFVTHSIGEAAFLANRAVVMSRRPGRIIFDQPIDLPEQRFLAMRTETRFEAIAQKMFEALQRAEKGDGT
jgi:NitT/TauT family transport system ATP-binding protein